MDQQDILWIRYLCVFMMISKYVATFEATKYSVKLRKQGLILIFRVTYG